MARLHHRALPGVRDHFAEGSGQFLVMEFVMGDDLGKLLRRERKAFDAARVMDWADTLLDALDYIHTQYPPVIHRDIKPENLKLTPRGDLYLLDFGLAKEGTTPTRAGKSIHGYTLVYAPPEQIKGTGTDARTDLYSLAATLYHLCTNQPPVDAKVREIQVLQYAMPDPLQPAHLANALVPFAFAAVLSKALAPEPTRRYQSAAEMREALRQAQQFTTDQQRQREEEQRLQQLLAEREREAQAQRQQEQLRLRELEWKLRREEEVPRQAEERLQLVTPYQPPPS
ncbi:MAG: serine/threonine protein kinase, partial [Acidobacteriota bacterium]|nr:serine/threonine protein kinase [Acidobacteriota bacterium]